METIQTISMWFMCILWPLMGLTSTIRLLIRNSTYWSKFEWEGFMWFLTLIFKLM